MRIGFDGRFIQDRYHGIGRYAFELLRALSADEDSKLVVFWNPDLPNERFDMRALVAHPRIVGVPLRLPLFSPQDQIALPTLARRWHLDLYHVPYFPAPLLLPCPLVVTIHDLIFERYPAYMPRRWARGYYAVMMRLALRRARAVLVPSNATRRDLVGHYRLDPGRVMVTPEGVLKEYRPASAAQIAEVRRRYGLPERFILNVGTRRPHKNVAAVVRALGEIRERVPHALVLAGERDRRFPDDLPALAAAGGIADRLITLGSVAEADLPVLYSAAEISVCTSLIEGFGLPVLESFACGTPVVTSDRSSLAEVGGDAALLIDPEDAAALAAALAALLTEEGLREHLRARGLARAGRFTWQDTATRTLEVYRRVARGTVSTPEKGQ